MATKNLKKVVRKIRSLNKNLTADKNPVNISKAIGYILAQDRRVVFKARMYQNYNNIIKTYIEAGHRLTRKMLKELKREAIEQTKAQLKAEAQTAAAAAQQSSQVQEAVQP